MMFPRTRGVAAAMSGASDLSGYALKVRSYSPIAYWTLGEKSGSVAYDVSGNGLHGSYTGVTLGQAGIGDGMTCPLFDASGDYVDIWSSGLQSAYDPDLTTLCVWSKVYASSVWADGSNRYIVQCGVNGTNRQWIQKSSTANRILLQEVAGGTTVGKNDDTAGNGWIHWALTIARVADELKAYRNGTQIGTTAGSLGTHAANIAESVTNVGSYNETPNNLWYGWIAHVALWDSILTQPQIAAIATV